MPKSKNIFTTNTNFIALLFLLSTICSCSFQKNLEGTFSNKPHHGNKSLKFISKNEFIQYTHHDYTNQMEWNYGKYKINKDTISLEYLKFPEDKKYKSTTEVSVEIMEESSRLFKLSIEVSQCDSSQLANYLYVISKNKKEHTEQLLDKKSIELSVKQENFPLDLTIGNALGVEKKINLEIAGSYYIKVCLDNSIGPAYDSWQTTKVDLLYDKKSKINSLFYMRINGEEYPVEGDKKLFKVD